MLIKGRVEEVFNILIKINTSEINCSLEEYGNMRNLGVGNKYYENAIDCYQFSITNVSQDLLECSHLHFDLSAVVQVRERRTGVRFFFYLI